MKAQKEIRKILLESEEKKILVNSGSEPVYLCLAVGWKVECVSGETGHLTEVVSK